MADLTWTTGADWDAEVANTGMVHDAAGDHAGAGTVQPGFEYASAPGLTAYWPLYETSGTTATDVSGNANDGTVSGATQGMGGILGGLSYAFDGVDDYIGISPIVSGDASGTVALWARPDFNGGNTGEYRLYDEQGSGEFTLLKFSDGFLYAGWNTGSDYRIKTDASVIFSAGEWVHLALCWDSSSTRLYVNGTQTDTGAAPSVATMSSASIGKKGNVSNVYYDGRLDDVRTYNTALSAAEVDYLASGPVNGTLTTGWKVA